MSNNSDYYDGTRLLSTLDLDGEKPALYMITTNRTGGKTTYFGRLVCNRFFETGDLFGLVYRFSYEIADCADKFYKDIGSLFFPGTNMQSIRKARGVYHELYIDNKLCGYAIALNTADQLKKYSHLFSGIKRLVFDEFQSETNHYCDNELVKFQSVYTSIARGQGKQSRYVPVYMLSNPVTILNPYYTELGVAERLRDDTKILRGHGWVLEQGYVDSAAQAMAQSAFAKAFANSSYMAYAKEAAYLSDNKAFIGKPDGKSRYIATIIFEGTHFAIREFSELGVLYVDDKPDFTFPGKLALTTADHNINYVMLKRNDLFIENMRYYWQHGAFRFKDLRAKEVIIKMLSY